MAKKADTWDGYKTTGISGYHMTGHDEQCLVEYQTFTCNHQSHEG